MGRILASVVFLSVCGCGPRGQDLSGAWALCVADSLAQSVCGTVTVGAAREGTFGYRRHYPLTFELDLDRALGRVTVQRPNCGSLLIAQDASISLLLPVQCGAVLEYDSRNLSADHLALTGDSIAGRWVQTCAAMECPAHGTLTMARARSK